MNIGILVLAAGYSRRFGADKRLHLVDGVPLLERAVRNLLAAELPVAVCIRPDDAAVGELLRRLAVRAIRCDAAGRGMGATLAQGAAAVAAAKEDWDGVLVALGDMAWVRPETCRRVAGALAPGRIARPCHRGRGGHPVGFAKAFFPELQRLDGEGGARELLRRHRANLLEVEVDDPGVLRDMDRKA